jgi:hypothetical protein
VRDGIIDDLCRNGRISLANRWENFTVSGRNATTEAKYVIASGKRQHIVAGNLLSNKWETHRFIRTLHTVLSNETSKSAGARRSETDFKRS